MVRASLYVGGGQSWSGLERDGLLQASLPNIRYMMNATTKNLIPDMSSPGTPRTATTLLHQGGSGKYSTVDTKCKNNTTRNNIVIGTWNVRTLNIPSKLEELAHTMKRYNWNVVGQCEMKWIDMGEITTREGHKL